MIENEEIANAISNLVVKFGVHLNESVLLVKNYWLGLRTRHLSKICRQDHGQHVDVNYEPTIQAPPNAQDQKALMSRALELWNLEYATP